ncbi:hypothetical protein C8F04DRAFT_1400747 [Mycena alexandri]|uniref:Uncharacterized protein n=1 Tax=Mycena alexandri TaxID=1745969 RepID=A0AAD6WSA0_9AGAR|nr:hypothetical protein C8F04DRAFT_1400747 [Mycena alexandri]
MAAPSLDEDLASLLAAINNLPASFRSGRRNDPLGKNLTPGLTKGNDPKPVFPVDKQNGAYYCFNNLWENVFQKRPEDDPDKLEKVVSNGRGKHGLILAHAWATHYGSVVRPDERGLVQLRVQNLLRLIDKTIRNPILGERLIDETPAVIPPICPFLRWPLRSMRPRSQRLKKQLMGRTRLICTAVTFRPLPLDLMILLDGGRRMPEH